MQITYYGQSCFAVVFGGKTLLFDPALSVNPLAKHIDIDTIKCDYILLSHGHGDHVADALRIAKNNDALIISNYEIVDWCISKGARGHHLNLGGKYTFPFGIVKYVAAVHSSTLPDGSSGGAAGGFVVWNEIMHNCFYFAGDTALTWDMKIIPMTCPQLDFAILPIGDNFTMGYGDALIASDFLEVETVIGCHFDSFGSIVIDKKEAIEVFITGGKELILPEVGAEVLLSMPIK